MPPLPPAPGVLKGRYVGTYGGKNWANVFHLQFFGGTPLPTDLNTLSSSLSGIWNTRIAPQCVPGVALTLTDLQDLTNNTGAYGSSSTGHVGTKATGTGLPNNVALCVSFKTSLHYRGGHPRMYLLGQSTVDAVDTAHWVGTTVNTVQTAMNSFITDIAALTSSSTGALSLVMLSYYSHKVLRAQGVPYPISGAVVHTRIDSMRRRLGKEAT